MDGNTNMSLDDEETKSAFVGALNMERGIYEEYTVMYAPFYRQMTFPLYSERKAESGDPLAIAYSDVEAASATILRTLMKVALSFLQGSHRGLSLL